jgi:hypothetical protein
MNLAPHPRLYISADHYRRLRQEPETPVLAAAARRVTDLAQKFLEDPAIVVDETGHNYHLIRARRMQTRVVTLLTEFRRIGDRRYRDEILEDVRRISEWEYWSWITWRQNDPRPEAIFDLSYGENSATLALAFDGLREDLTDAEVALFVETARRRALGPYLHVNGGEKKQGYYRKPDTNWNTVCNGGAGMLALAMGDLCPESEQVVALVEEGVAPFFEFLRGDGAWPEGIGYWNYGMRYGFMYLLSHERATGRRHPLLERAGTQATLLFPLVFSPNGVPCSFGDVNHFSPLPFHVAAAERFGREDILAELDRRLEARAKGGMSGTWPDDAELLLLHPRRRFRAKAPWKRASLQEGLEWGYLADRWPTPSLYVAVRGGTTDAPHVHRDLMSYFCLVGDERLIENVPVDDYLDTTFSPRRYELYETSATSKNAVFINGVGITDRVTARTTLLTGAGYEGFRLDVTEAMGTMRDGPVARFCGRAILMVRRKGVLVIDRVEVPYAALVESRLHTFFKVTFGKGDATVRGKKGRLHVSFAASQPARVKPGMGMPTNPAREPDTTIRHVSERKVHEMTLCHFLMPGGRAKVALTEKGERTTVAVTGDLRFKISFGTTGMRF